MKCKENIQSFIDCLMIDNCERVVLCDALDYITQLNTRDMNRNLMKVDELFCICARKLNHDFIADNVIIEKIDNAFENIRYKDKKSDDVNYITVKFLSQIKGLELDDHDPSDELIEKYEKLCENLEKMHGLFQIKRQNELLFPIGKMLNYVIKNEDFISNRLDIIGINTLLFALEIFKPKDDIRKKINEIIKTSNLKCLKYLQDPKVKKVGGEDGWKCNFKVNGSLTLLIPHKDSFDIYIRHEKKEYFTSPVLEDLHLEEEVNSRGQPIAYYCVIPNDKKIKIENVQNLISTSDLLKLHDFCKMIFLEKKMNVFLENSFIRIESELKITNPFLINDRYIVLNEKPWSVNNNSWIKHALKPYFLLKIGSGFDYVMLGSIFKLLEHNSDSIDDVFSVLKKMPEKIQDSVIEAWAKSIDNSSNYVSEIQSLQDDYFGSIRYAQKKSAILEKRFNDFLWLPYKFPSEIIDHYIEKKYNIDNNREIIKISTGEDFEDKVIYKDMNGEIIESEKISFGESSPIVDRDFYAIYDKNAMNIEYENDVDNLFRIKKRIDEDNLKYIEVGDVKSICLTEIEHVVSLMKLQTKALVEKSECIDFESVAYSRLLNHLIYNGVFRKKMWESFYSLLMRHQKISFKNVKDDISEYESPNTLFVPKEHRNTDNALVSIFDTYIHKACERERDFFKREIYLDESSHKYCLEGGEEIKKVVVLFDTLQSGTSTIDILKAYFGKPEESKSLNKICKFYNYRVKPIKEIPLKKIIQTNKASLIILSLYGSKEGKENVDAYIKSSNNILKQAKEILVKHKIRIKADRAIVDEMEKIYPKEDREDVNDLHIKEGNFLIIREFNQPKRNMFPNRLLDSACIASIFVKKPEFREK